MDTRTAINSRTARIIAAQFYVAKGLRRNPAQTIKFILNNRDYFPTITDYIIEQVKKENNLSDEDIDKQQDIKFADIDAEHKKEQEEKRIAKEIHENRKNDNANRNYKHKDVVRNVYEPKNDSTKESG